MAAIPDAVRRFLGDGPLAHVVTLDPDGTPRVTLAWAGVDGDEIVMATFFNTEQKKVQNLRRDPRVTLSFEAKDSKGEALHPYLVVQGRARITEGGALDVMDHLAQFYIGPGQTFPMREVPAGIVYHVTVDRIYGQGGWRNELESA
jgi:PPOX class probable F420-dependent enzyme